MVFFGYRYELSTILCRSVGLSCTHVAIVCWVKQSFPVISCPSNDHLIKWSQVRDYTQLTS